MAPIEKRKGGEGNKGGQFKEGKERNTPFCKQIVFAEIIQQNVTRFTGCRTEYSCDFAQYPINSYSVEFSVSNQID